MNHKLPSGPAVIPFGDVKGVGMANSVMAPDGVIRPILLPVNSVNHNALSGPLVIPKGTLPAVGTGYSLSVIGSEVVSRPIFGVGLPNSSVNQSALSKPNSMSKGELLAVGSGYSVKHFP